MPLYSIDIPVFATAYVKAADEEEALKQAIALGNSGLELPEVWEGEVPIFGKRFDHPDMPDVSLSPAMTIGEMAPKTLYIASIHHKHGTTCYVGRTEQQRAEKVAAWCKQWWDELPDLPAFDMLDAQEAVEAYFAEMEAIGGSEYVDYCEDTLTPDLFVELAQDDDVDDEVTPTGA